MFTDFGYDMITGKWLIDGAGDIDVDAGVALRRKLIFRRIITTPGAFYHLPTYGVGLKPKELDRPGSLLLLENRIRQHLSRESGIVVDLVRVTSRVPGIYEILVKATFQSEDAITVELRVSDRTETFSVQFS